MYPRRRDSIQRSVSQIIQLHEELLAELYKVVPTSGSGHGHLSSQNSVRRSKHTRWHSVETALLRPRTTILRRRLRHSVDLSHSQEQSARSLVVTTNTVLDVAKVFHRFVRLQPDRIVALTLADEALLNIRSLRRAQWDNE